MLGGSLFAHQAQKFQELEGRFFDVTISVELQEMPAKDLSTVLERITGVIGPRLARDQASFHISVKPTPEKRNVQPYLCFPERDIAA
jgi:hypothetical protein